MKSYNRLGLDDREEISRGLARGRSLRDIAKDLGCNVSTVSREVRRYSRRWNYRAHTAQRKADRQAKLRKSGKRKLVMNPKLLKVIKDKLLLFWSPEQIAKYLKSHYKCSSMHVSAETIYSYIYVFLRRNLREEFINQLRQKRKRRRVRGRTRKGERNTLKDMVSIEERPAEVQDRLVPGHWEGDLMIGGTRDQSALGTLVERHTRYAILVPLKSKKAEEVRRAFAREIKKLPKELRLSITYDQGREMAQHKLFSEETEMKVYFAHPQSPWERGTNENTNGLVRQWFPKGTNFYKVTRAEIKKAQKLLNDRPRKTLGYKTRKEVLRELLQ